jgi:hypothetical protein
MRLERSQCHANERNLSNTSLHSRCRRYRGSIFNRGGVDIPAACSAGPELHRGVRDSGPSVGRLILLRASRAPSIRDAQVRSRPGLRFREFRSKMQRFIPRGFADMSWSGLRVRNLAMEAPFQLLYLFGHSGKRRRHSVYSHRQSLLNLHSRYLKTLVTDTPITSDSSDQKLGSTLNRPGMARA